MSVIHYDIVTRFSRSHPEWRDDSIPLCDCDDTAADGYTRDKRLVTCPDCLTQIKAEEATEAANRG